MDSMDEVQALWDSIEDNPSSKKSSGKYVPVPDGEHTAVIKNAGVSTSEGKAPALFFELYFPQHNTTETSYNNITAREGAIKALKSQLRGLGLSSKSGHPAELDRLAKSTVGATVKVKKQTKDNPGGKAFRNYYLNGVIAKPQTTQAADSDIPF